MAQTLPMRRFAPFLALFGAAAAAEPIRLSADQALAADAALYAQHFGVPTEEALLRLRQQQASIAVTDRLRVRHAEMLAAIEIEHRPRWGVVVRLTSGGYFPPVVERANGLDVPVRFENRAPSTRAVALRVLDAERAALPRLVPGYRGAGVDPATGGLIIMQRPGADRRTIGQAEQALYDRLGLPVRIRRLEATMTDSAALGGGRVDGTTPDGRRWRCTTGFVVRNAAGTLGVTTAAHCPDNVSWRGPDGEERALALAGAWGNAEHDVQIHIGVGPAEPLVYSDTAKTSVRPVTTWATRPMTRVGDWLCLRGESSGHACSLVELTDFAPAGDLCGGLCAASWVTLAGPRCRRGDSGAPIFLGTTAYGTLKGGAYTVTGGCAFSYFQSVDYLPGDWRVLTVR